MFVWVLIYSMNQKVVNVRAISVGAHASVCPASARAKLLFLLVGLKLGVVVMVGMVWQGCFLICLIGSWGPICAGWPEIIKMGLGVEHMCIAIYGRDWDEMECAAHAITAIAFSSSFFSSLRLRLCFSPSPPPPPPRPGVAPSACHKNRHGHQSDSLCCSTPSIFPTKIMTAP
jgi:hypothetical protein